MGKNQTTPKSTVLGSIYNWSIPELFIVSDAEGCRRRSETEGIDLGLRIAALLSCSTGTGIRDVSRLSAALSGGAAASPKAQLGKAPLASLESCFGEKTNYIYLGELIKSLSH